MKGAVRFAHVLATRFEFVARFDIKAYYESMDHQVLFEQLANLEIESDLYDVVQTYLRLPDSKNTGRGMVAGGAISPFLAAVYLTPLDRAMEVLEKSHGIKYQRYMDDFLIFAPARHKLKAVLRTLYSVLDTLKLTVHPDKRYIGKTQKGGDFLGYRIHPGRKLRPARQSLNRLLERAHRLFEQGANEHRFRGYVWRWYLGCMVDCVTG